MAGEARELLHRDGAWGCLAWLISFAILLILVGLSILPTSIFDHPIPCSAIFSTETGQAYDPNYTRCDF